MKIFGPFLVFFCGYIATVFGSLLIGNPTKKQASFDRFDGTCRGHNVPVIFNYYGVKTEGNKMYINSTITAKEDVSGNLVMSIRIQRCKNRENLDTCEEFHSYKTDKYCSLIEEDSELWSPFFSAFQPKYKCPITKGSYRGINGMLDISAFLLFPMENWFWKVAADVNDRDTNRLIKCLVVEGHVIVNKALNVTDLNPVNSNFQLMGQKIG